MIFRDNDDTVLGLFQFKHRDDIFTHELCGNRLMNQIWEFGSANSYILFNLNYPKSISSAFYLYRKNVVHASLINPDVDFICFYLP